MKPGKQVRDYKSKDGLRVTIFPLEEPADHALVRITGIEHPWDGQVLLHQVRRYNDKVDYVQKVQGKDYVTVTQRAPSGSQPVLTCYPPTAQDGVTLEYVEADVAQSDPGFLIRQFKAQLERGPS